MKALLCSTPVEGANSELDRERWEGPLGVVPQIAIISLINWMKLNGYTKDNYDFYDIYLLYPTDSEIKDYIKQYKPDVVGLSAVVSTSYSQVKRISKIIKDINPNIWVVVGGYITASSDTILRKCDVDLCFIGDGEIAWVKFLNYVEKYGYNFIYEELEKIKGVSYLNNNNLCLTGYGDKIPNDQIPFPDYDILAQGMKNKPDGVEYYFREAKYSGWFHLDPRKNDKHRKPMVAGTNVSKGCVAKCTFCQRASKGYRTQSLENFKSHLIELKDKWNVGFVQILDENFGSDKKHSRDVAIILKELDLLWIATGIRCKSVNYDDLKFYKEHNCSALKFGVESGSDKILSIMEKKFNIDDVYNAIHACIKLNLYSPIALMLGMPGETEDTAKETGQFIGTVASMLNAHPKVIGYDLFYALPLPGTPLYEYGQFVGVIPDEPEGEDTYLTKISNAGIYKRYYINLNGAHIKEVLWWEWAAKLEASRTYHSKTKNKKHIDNSALYVQENKIATVVNPRLNLKYSSLKFTYFTRIFDDYIDGNKYVDMIPRVILYPFLKNMLYLEYLIQNIFASNRKNNMFNMMRVKRFDYYIDKVDQLSLRKVLKFINPDPDADPNNKSRLNKKLLIKGI